MFWSAKERFEQSQKKLPPLFVGTKIGKKTLHQLKKIPAVGTPQVGTSKRGGPVPVE